LKDRLLDTERLKIDIDRNLQALYSTKDALTEQIIKLDNEIAGLE